MWHSHLPRVRGPRPAAPSPIATPHPALPRLRLAQPARALRFSRAVSPRIAPQGVACCLASRWLASSYSSSLLSSLQLVLLHGGLGPARAVLIEGAAAADGALGGLRHHVRPEGVRVLRHPERVRRVHGAACG